MFDPDAPNHYRESARLLGPNGKSITSNGEAEVDDGEKIGGEPETLDQRVMAKRRVGLFAQAGEMATRAIGL